MTRPDDVSSLPSMAQKKKEPSFDEIVTRLEAIARELEAGDTKLEAALALFEEGVGLVKNGKERLDQAEKRLEILRDGGATAPFDPEQTGHES